MTADDEKIDALIKEIALRNGVAVGRRDPIMMVQTMNSLLMKETKEAQQQALDNFKAELEEIAHRWSEDAKVKAERVLNASLTASKDAMAIGMAEGAKRSSAELQEVMMATERKIDLAMKRERAVSLINLIASLLVVGSVVVLLWVR